MNKTLQYAGSGIDRADHLRRDQAELERLWQSDTCLIVPMLNERSLLLVDAHPATVAVAMIPLKSELADCLDEDCPRVFLGVQSGSAVFGVEINACYRDSLPARWSGGVFLDVRGVGSLLDNETATLLAYARALLFWQKHTRYCALCGSPTSAIHGGHVMACQNEPCARQHFPRLEPAVIMLIEHRPPEGEARILLGRGPGWAEGVFSTLAGFVEPGESLEDAVRREVFEEAGVRVGDVRYVASQPWPFPASIMLGFMGEALGTALDIDTHELAEAQWFTASEVRAFGNWGEEGVGYKMPRSDSISRFLIEAWLARESGDGND